MKKKYRELCEKEPTIPLFSKDWWLDSVAGSDNWDVALIETGGKIVASMPYVIKKKYGLTFLIQPPLSQTLGPWIRETDAKLANQLSREKDLMQALIEQLPKFDHFSQNWHYSRTNWLPFYWKDFKQTTRYTYVLKDLSNLEKVFSEFSHAKRKNIRKAEKIIKVVYDISANDFYENHKMTLSKQGAEISYSYDLFKRIYQVSYEKNFGRTIAAYDENNHLHAALFIVWDDMSAYDLISTIDPDFRNYGAASLLIREIVCYTSVFAPKFDFEGSMIEPVERSFRQFGAEQVPYFSLTKTPSRLLRLYKAIKNIR